MNVIETAEREITTSGPEVVIEILQGIQPFIRKSRIDRVIVVVYNVGQTIRSALSRVEAQAQIVFSSGAYPTVNRPE